MFTRIATALLFLLILTPAVAQDQLGGASQPKPQLELTKGFSQYKRIHQFALRLILRDRSDEAEALLKSHLISDRSDPESHYLLGLLYAHKGQTEAAITMFRKSIILGLPLERVLAGPRELIKSVENHEFFQLLRKQTSRKPLHGPIVGNVTDHSASFWVRTPVESTVHVSLNNANDIHDADDWHSGSAETNKKDDYTTVIHVKGLKPNSTYLYFVVVDDGSQDIAGNTSDSSGDEPQPLSGFTPEASFSYTYNITDDLPRFQTFPKPQGSSKFQLAFGGGAGYVPQHERMWDTIGTFKPLALLLLGDNTYIDDPESLLLQQYTYHRRQSRPEFRRLTARTAVFSIWDDHDFGTNDCWGGPLIETPFWKKDYAWTLWKQNWPNPGFGGGVKQPGCWYSFSIGDVDFIMLDCRYYRTDPHGKNPSMLGPVQLKWFEETLKKCRGKFKVICSSVPWDFRTKGDSFDTWNGYRDERERIFQMIERARIPGVILMSADRHRSDAWKIDRKKGYDFYEFNSSRLTNQHVHPTMEKEGAIFSYNAKQSFGLVSFDTTVDDPTVTYEVVTIDGEKMHSLTVKSSQLGY